MTSCPRSQNNEVQCPWPRNTCDGMAQVVGTSKMHSYGLIDYNLNYQVRPSFHCQPVVSCCIIFFRSLLAGRSTSTTKYPCAKFASIWPFQAEPLLDQGQFGSSKATDADAAETPALKVAAWERGWFMAEREGHIDPYVPWQLLN